MNRPQPVYTFDAARVERLLERLREMYRSNAGYDRYNEGVRFGIRSASLAVKEELDLGVINTLSGPYEPTPTTHELVTQLDVVGINELSDAVEYHEVRFSTLVAAAVCDHEFEVIGQLPDGEDQLSTCMSCDAPRDFLEQVGWPLGTIACPVCSFDDHEPCGECGRGIGA